MNTSQQHDRRWRSRRESQAMFYDAINDRRRPNYDRRGRALVRALQGATRPAVGEPLPCAERRRVPEGGTE